MNGTGLYCYAHVTFFLSVSCTCSTSAATLKLVHVPWESLGLVTFSTFMQWHLDDRYIYMPDGGTGMPKVIRHGSLSEFEVIEAT